MSRLLAAAASTTLALALPAQTLTLAEGAPGALQVVALAEANPNGPATTVLQNVEFLPLEITARTRARELDTTRSRRTTRNGLDRVELPGGGRLFRYRRSGGAFYGFLLVLPDGSPHVVFERAGTGSALDDPFTDRIAVADDGAHAAIGLLAGGLWAVRLDGGTYPSTGRADRQVAPAASEVLPASVLLGPSHAFWITNQDEVFRCSLADLATAVAVSPPLVQHGRFQDQMALSHDGQHCVFLYGPRDQQQFWHVATNGGPVLLPPPPSKYEAANYLPEGAGEPSMLVDDAGTRLFYIDSTVRDELHLLDLNGVLPDLQITENQIFQPYIGAHILPKFTPTADLLVAIGDPAAMDWFRVSMSAQGGAVTNLTGTGSLQQPFPAGALDPLQAADTGAAVLVTEQAANGQVLRKFDAATGAQAVVQQAVTDAPQVGSTFAGAGDTLVHGAGGDVLYHGTAASFFAATPSGVLLTPPVQGPFVSATWVHLTNGWGAVVLYLPDGTLIPGPFEFGVGQITMTLQGGVVIVGANVRYVAPGADLVLNRPAAASRVVLSGAGG